MFTGTKPDEDPQRFVDEMKKTLRVMHPTETEVVELASLRLKYVASAWYEMWENSHGTNAPPAVWD